MEVVGGEDQEQLLQVLDDQVQLHGDNVALADLVLVVLLTDVVRGLGDGVPDDSIQLVDGQTLQLLDTLPQRHILPQLFLTLTVNVQCQITNNTILDKAFLNFYIDCSFPFLFTVPVQESLHFAWKQHTDIDCQVTVMLLLLCPHL